MPVEWVTRREKAPESSGAFLPSRDAGPAIVLHLWPNRSLPARGFVLFIGLTAGMIALPLVAVLGSPVLWGILPFFLLVLGGMWYAIERNTRDGQLLEELSIWPDRMLLVRHNPKGQRQTWEANPYWVRLALRPEGGPVANYLTLKGGGREVELGAFLSPDERAELHAGLERALGRLR